MEQPKVYGEFEELKELSYNARMAGVVTLYHPDVSEVVANILRYLPWLDLLIVWDNSPLEERNIDNILPLLGDDAAKVVWQGDGRNHMIADAVNFAWKYAGQNGYELLLIMDQDSRWEDFAAFRRQVEMCVQDNPRRVYCPYVTGNDTFEIEKEVQERRTFINSGTVIPVSILSTIGGVDENFPLDALDYDMAHRILAAGYSIVCLTQHRLYHVIGRLQRMGQFDVLTSNYSAERTYSIARSHMLYLRKHWHTLTTREKWYIIKEHYIKMPLRILLADPEKRVRMKQFFKGMHDGMTCKNSKII